MNEVSRYPALYLKAHEDARLRAGHLWVFSNEIDTAHSPLNTFEPGAAVTIVAADGRPLGVGYVNPHSLICARIVSRDAGEVLDAAFLAKRLRTALAWRESLYAEPYYRVLYGESDGVPGLTLDRFGDVLVAQATTAGIDALRGAVESAVREVIAPQTLIWKNDAGIRALEGLPGVVETAFGEAPEQLEVHEGGVRFVVDALGGQKTGWFYDQHANRDELAPLVEGKRVLDVCAYVGAWGLRAAAFGAREVTCVDASARAVELIALDAHRNGFADTVKAVRADAFDYLKAQKEAGAQFDVVVLDPPAFIKRRKDFKPGLRAYRRLNELALALVAPGGVLVTCSCSYHLPRAALLDAVQAGAQHVGRSVQVVRALQQSPDHPVHPAIPETDYLKGFVVRVLLD